MKGVPKFKFHKNMFDVLKVTNIVVILSDIDENFKINRATVHSRIYTRKII